MRRPPPRNRFAPGPLLQRVERASACMTPYLVVLAIGLALLNLTCVALLAPHLTLTVTRRAADGAPIEVGCGMPPNVDAALASEN
jgi:hypothetical protein